MENKKNVVFISHQLFTKGNLEDNIKSMYKMAEKIESYGYTPIVVANMFPWLIKDGKEIDRDRSMSLCRNLILKCDFLVFDNNKRSEGVDNEIAFAIRNKISVFDIESLNSIFKPKK